MIIIARLIIATNIIVQSGWMDPELHLKEHDPSPLPIILSWYQKVR